MKVKFTLQRQASAVDLVATVDAAATVGDLATYLAAADPEAKRGRLAQERLTLGLNGSRHVTLDPRQPIAESMLCSGATVTIGVGGKQFDDPKASPAAIVTVVEGPDSGKEFRLALGSSIIGRQPGSEILLTDALVSRAHARLNVTDVVEIVDLGSANGVLIDDVSVPRSVLRSSDVVQLGDTKLSVRVTHRDRDPQIADGGATGFVRSPRVEPGFVPHAFEVPEAPERQAGPPFPVIMLIMPVLMAGVLFAISKNAASLAFVALSPMMMIGNNVQQRMAKRSSYKHLSADFREDVDLLKDEMAAALVLEAAARRQEHPSAEECTAALRDRDSLLWSRQPGGPGFGEIRLGLGTQLSRSSLEYSKGKRSTREVQAVIHGELDPYVSVPDVPIAASFCESPIGIAGPSSLTTGLVRGLLLQVACLHSPAELAIGLLTSGRNASLWDWLKWLPHSSTPHSPVSAQLLAASPTVGAALLTDLENMIEERSTGRNGLTTPGVLVIVDDEAAVEHSRLVELARRGGRAGVYVLWLASSTTHLPAACRTSLSVDISAATGTARFVGDATTVTSVGCEQVDAESALAAARAMAPLIDIGARLDDDSDLPRSVSLLTITGPELAESAEAVLERWTANRSIITGPRAPKNPPKHVGTLRAVVGTSGLDVHALDLRTDGPHALVGGTTGAGKSELLQSWILGMAMAHSPQRLTFLLVDYKGGSAFRDCVDLPHTVGLVTDLSPHLVRRALTSLSAELRYREEILAKHAAKDLATMEKAGIAEAPPSLVLVVDEFAALVKEVPEFVDGVVNVAQRGRSLGLHLVLATQRPAGVIKDNLRANTNLRLALRMADEADSNDVLGSPDAGFFDPSIPGRAMSKTGPRRLVHFQAGYVGGWTSKTPPAPDIAVEELSVAAGSTWLLPDEPQVAVVDAGATDIQRVVARVNEASHEARIAAPRKPWQPELQSLYNLADRNAVPTRRSDTELVFGIGDDPKSQSQPTVAFRPDKEGNLVVYGASGSGKSALLRTLAISAGMTFHGGPCHVFGVDCGARGLAMLEQLPHVGSIISGSDQERVERLLRWLRSSIDERAVRYSRENAGTISDYRRISGASQEARILVLVDGYPSFRAAYEGFDRGRLMSLFTSIVADGRPLGVHVALSSDQRGSLGSALNSSIQARVVLRMANVDDYAILGVPPDVLDSSVAPGRGIFDGHEIQVAVLGDKTDPLGQAGAIKRFASAMRRNNTLEASPIGSLPERVDLSELPVTVDGLPSVGVDAETLAPLGVDLSGSWLVAGPSLSGRTSTMLVLAQTLGRSRPTMSLVFIGDARSSLYGLEGWTTVISVEDVPSMSTELEAQIRGGERLGLFIERAGDLVDTPADKPLQSLAKLAIANGCTVVSDGEAKSLRSTFGLLAVLNSSRSGILLSNEAGDGESLFRVPVPGTPAASRVPGRGAIVYGTKVAILQVAHPDVK